MEASVSIFRSSNRHLSNSLLIKTLCPKPFLSCRSPLPVSYRDSHLRCSRLQFYSLHSPIRPPNQNPAGFIRRIPASVSPNSPISTNRFARILLGPHDDSVEWKFALDGLDGGDVRIAGDREPIVTVVLLGWLGSKKRHLNKYAELYNAVGFDAVTFTASVKDVLSFDLGRRLEERISGLASRLASWLSETEKDGRERLLFFHTFSNTGWLGYGAILDYLRDRSDILEKIRGCVVDSGGDPEIDPKVWAAGFATALLKKNSSAAYPSSGQTAERNELENGAAFSKVAERKPLFVEIFLLMLFEKLFSYLLNLPDVNRRLTKIISTLSENQPRCPQLYLYSTADRVIPYQRVEAFMDEQRRKGLQVHSFNFGLSPHVDHYRTFPDAYSSGVRKFLKECFHSAKQA